MTEEIMDDDAVLKQELTDALKQLPDGSGEASDDDGVSDQFKTDGLGHTPAEEDDTGRPE